MKKYEPIDISGDVGLRAFGKKKEDVFINAAIGMYSLITDIDLIEEKKSIELTVDGFSLENLFVSWLNELIFQFDANGFIGKRVIVSEVTSFVALPSQGDWSEVYKLNAILYGQDFDPERHESRLLIKAATYHQLKIEKIDDTWKAEVIFDI